MADHINISDPDCPRQRSAWDHRLQVELLKTELKIVQAERDHWRDNLEAVFTRIRRGDEVWITGDDGERIIVRAEAPTQGPRP